MTASSAGWTRYTSRNGNPATRRDLTAGVLSQPGQIAPDSGHSRTGSTISVGGGLKPVAESGPTVLVPSDLGAKLGKSRRVIPDSERHRCCLAARSAAS